MSDEIDKNMDDASTTNEWVDLIAGKESTANSQKDTDEDDAEVELESNLPEEKPNIPPAPPRLFSDFLPAQKTEQEEEPLLDLSEKKAKFSEIVKEFYAYLVPFLGKFIRNLQAIIKSSWAKFNTLRRNNPRAKYAVLVIALLIMSPTIKNQFSSSTTPSKTAVFGTVTTDKEQAKRLLFPTKLPNGYNSSDIEALPAEENAKNIYILTLNSSEKPAISITQQEIPSNYDFESFYASFQERADIVTRAGKATSGVIQNGMVRIVSIAGNSSWTIINADSSVPLDDLAMIAQGLE